MADVEYQRLSGRPEFLAAKAAHYAAVAVEIARSVQTLTKIQGEQMTSQAIDKLKDSSGDVADDITKAYDRYDTTAQALAAYAVELRAAQDDAEKAIIAIEQRQSDAEAAHHSAATAQQDADAAGADQQADAQRAAQQAQDAADDAQRALSAAHGLWTAALERKNSAAHTAAAAIDSVVNGTNNHGLKDSWWDNWGSKLYDIIKQVCTWAGVLSIFLGWVPILGQILLVLAAVGAVIDLIDAVIATIAGNGSIFDLVMAVVGVALTFVGGAAFARLAKGLKDASFLKVVAPALNKGGVADFAAVRDVKSIMGEEASLNSMISAARKVTSQTGWRDVAKDMFTDALKPFHPKLAMSEIAKLKPSSLRDVFAKAFEEGVIPNPIKMLKIDGDYLKALRLLAMNPALAKQAEIAVPLIGTSVYQADQTFNAITGYADAGRQGPGQLALSLGGDGAGATSSIVSDIRSLEWKNNG
ncbi:MAG TPA: hypothetical protein VGC45_14050 [Gryllotalpicola sp.]